MEFLVHMKVAPIDGGEEREKQLREQEAVAEPGVGKTRDPVPYMESAGKARELGHLEG